MDECDYKLFLNCIIFLEFVKDDRLMGSIVPEEFFEKSWETVMNSPEYKNAKSDEDREKMLLERGNVIGVVGKPRAGKSTFIKIIMSRIVDENEKLYNVEYIFQMKLREVDYRKKTDLLTFLIGHRMCDWMHDPIRRNAVLEHILTLDSVCILLDGLDEACLESSTINDTTRTEFDHFTEELPEHFLLGLLAGKLFTKAKLIIASRTQQLLELPERYRPKYIIKVFNNEDEEA